MSVLNDLKRELSVIGIAGVDQKGNYRVLSDIIEDFGLVYQKFFDAGVSTAEMKLLDQMYYDIINNWDKAVQDERNKSCSNRTQIRENQRTLEDYIELVGGTDQTFIRVL